jgi:predicted GIY-YIG superfamily endonuclease
MNGWKYQKCISILKTNNYPVTLINRLISKFLHPPIPVPVINHENANTQMKYRSIVYVKGLSEQIAKILKSEDPSLQISFRNNLNANPFFTKLKDPIDMWEKDHVIYCIWCECGAVYIGMTIQMLRERFYNHQSNINKLLVAVSSGSTEELTGVTALTKHAQETGHKIDLKSAKILKQCSNGFKL